MTRVVFIEDRSLMLEALKHTISWQENDIEPIGFFSSCDEALPFILEEKPDVVVSDIVMHGMDGLELSKYLFDSDLEIKVIIVSAYSRFDYAQRALQTNVFDYFEKPLNFDELIKSIQRAGKANNELRQTRTFILNHLDFYRERLFTKLLLGQEERKSLRDEADFLQIQVDQGFFCVVCKLVSVVKNENNEPLMRREIKHMQVAQKLTDFFKEARLFGPYSFPGGEFVFVLNQLGAEKEIDISQKLVDIGEELRLSYSTILHAGIGKWVKTLEELQISYDVARSALDRCFSFDEVCVISSKDVQLAGANEYFLKFSRFETSAIRALQQQDIPTLRQIFELFRKEIDDTFLSSDMLKTMMKSIVLKMNTLIRPTPLSLDSIMTRIDLADHLADVFEVVADFLVKGCETNRKEQDEQSLCIAEKAHLYIEDHYSNRELSLNEIAGNVNVSPNYLCSLFKKEYGVGIHEYITELRIEKAKQLLTQTDMGVGLIGEMVGYTNPYHFSVSFKKYTNMTPTEHRKKEGGGLE